MRNVVITHGKPTKERYEDPSLPKPHQTNWFPWAKDQLEGRGIPTDVPALPKPYYPVYPDWRDELLRYRLESDTGLVAFSASVELMLRLLSEDKQRELERLVLVAPWRDRQGKYGDFSHYILDRKIGERIGRLTIISSIDDDSVIRSNAYNLVGALPATKLIELDGYGHFLQGNNMASPEFPELIGELLDA